MQATMQATPISNQSRWTGRALSAISILFLLMDGGVKLFNPPPVVEAMTQLQIPDHLTVGIGALLLICTLIYAIPRTAILGAVLLTGYLGGAMAVQLRIEAPLFSLVFPVLIGALVWGGLYLREPRLRALLPISS